MMKKENDLKKLSGALGVLVGAFVGFIGVSQFLGILTNLYKLGKNSGNTQVFNEIIVVGIQAWAIIMSCILFVLIVRNVSKKRVFVDINEKLLLVFGIFIFLMALLSIILIKVLSVNELLMNASYIAIIMGFTFVFFSLVLKIGRKLQEEQELTI